jgi:hypothetical protein
LFRKAYTLVVVILIPFLNLAQVPREKSAQKHISKQHWVKAFTTLEKSISKEPASAPAYFLMSTWYFSPRNPDFNVDSAYRYVQKSIKLWAGADSRNRSQWSRLPLDSLMLASLKERIDSAAFDQARKVNSVASYTDFIENHPESQQHQTAIELRYGVAFEKAVAANTFESFQAFTETYPEAPQVDQARNKYDELLFLNMTRDGRLESYENFIRDNPNSPHRALAEETIFEIVTAKGKPENFVAFLTRYPESSMKKRASDILYHILRERNEPFPQEFSTDSIASLRNLEKDYLVPVLIKGKFGMINASGKVVITPEYDEIDEGYLCGDIAEDVVVLPGRMVNRRGHTLLQATISGIEDEGYGYLNVQVNGKNIIYHKSGFRVGDFPVDEFRVLNGRLLGIRSSGKWGVFTLGGKSLLPFGFDDLDNFDDVLVLKNENGFMMSGMDTIAAQPVGNVPFLVGPFDEVRKMGDNVLTVKDDTSSVWNQRLTPIIIPGGHTITPAFFGAIVQTDSGYNSYNRFGEPSESFEKITVSEPWIAAKAADGWVLYNPDQRIYKSVPYDTLTLFGPFAIGKNATGYELNLHRKPERPVIISQADQFEFLPGKDSISYLAVVHGSKKTVYDADGKVLFTLSTPYDKIETAGNGYFIVTKKEKKGLISPAGKLVVPIQFDAIGTAVNGMISILKGAKFGAFDIEHKVLFPAVYDKNIQRFDRRHFIAYKDGAYGFVDNKNKVVGAFSFSDVQPWKDSVAIVRQNTLYQFYNVYSKEAELAGISHLKTIRNTAEERLTIVNKEGKYGVISNRTGVVIPVNFSDIVNVGSAEQPMYFTEKHVQEASIFVVIYYDAAGKMLRREVYEQDEYERIYCDKK